MEIFSVQIVLNVFINYIEKWKKLGKAIGESQILMNPSISAKAFSGKKKKVLTNFSSTNTTKAC